MIYLIINKKKLWCIGTIISLLKASLLNMITKFMNFLNLYKYDITSNHKTLIC